MSFFKKTTPATVLDLRSAPKRTGRASRRHPRLIVISLILITTLVLLAAAYFYIAAHLTKPGGKSAMQSAVSNVSQLMVLPTNETPTYGTVADRDKLKDQTFFKNAQNGDEVLIYENAKLSILYRPSIKKIVNVGPLVIGSSGSPYVTSRFAVKNGTSDPGLLTKMTTAIKSAYPNANIVSMTQASRTYPATISIDLTKKNQPLDEQIADSLNIQAGQPPLGEPLPDADFLIIIGEDYVNK